MSFIAIAGLIFATACESSDDSDDMNGIANLEEVKSTVTSGTWQVALFEEDGIAQTSNFSGYGFVFEATGELIADNGETSVSGA
ncbi:hypothetical protein NYZ99_03980 [Maribacter litopenaei]|uniref:Lipocalin-like domain-containing protein n=1 Tax=Maribacter litopenaei TaxID=2976127 RepID=A0ABY5Y9E0_9FLAO|nr:hypothetical protein [Maribacter litopenaei]UWX55631.1 hypothetical protein NYZ99_03980 [Maribacter litopenaei]